MSHSGESPEYIDNILDSLRKKEKTYAGGADVYHSLGGMTMTALGGPMGSGKSSTSDEIILLDEDFKLVDTTTTRPHRDGDPEGFQTGFSYTDFNNGVINGSFVNFNIIGQNAYGTFPSGFKGKHNIGPIMARSMPQMLVAGFDEVNFVYMLVEEQEYERRLRAERIDFSDFIPRLIEGDESMEFAKDNLHENWMHFVESKPVEDGVTKAARAVINIVRHNSGEFITEPRVLELLDGMHHALHRVARDVH